MPQIPLLAVVGPTASGKTALGIELARYLNSEILSIDSMQVYQHLDIGTAKPTLEERSQAIHHMIDIREPDDPINAGVFAELTGKIIQGLYEKNKVPVLVGGTGLYMRALLHGLIDAPEISKEIHDDVWNQYRTMGLKSCHDKLSLLDPKTAAKLHPNDSARVLRALEVRLQSGKSMEEYQQQHQFAESPYSVTWFAINWDRQVLYERINLRVIQMVSEGLIEETESLLKAGYSEELPALKSIGYLQAVAHLRGKLGKDEMIADIQQKTRRYAKKQLTWYRKDKDIHWIQPDYTPSDWQKVLSGSNQKHT